MCIGMGTYNVYSKGKYFITSATVNMIATTNIVKTVKHSFINWSAYAPVVCMCIGVWVRGCMCVGAKVLYEIMHMTFVPLYLHNLLITKMNAL